MDVLILLQDCDDDATGRPALVERAGGARPVAYVHWVPVESDDVAFWSNAEASGREVITLCGDPDAPHLALALAAALEGRRSMLPGAAGAVRHLGVWGEAGASGDVAWRDRTTGEILTHDIDIAASALAETAGRLLAECGALLRQTTAKLAMPDWPEGMRRAISFRFAPPGDLAAAPLAMAGGSGDGLLASLREADGYDDDGY